MASRSTSSTGVSFMRSWIQRQPPSKAMRAGIIIGICVGEVSDELKFHGLTLHMQL